MSRTPRRWPLKATTQGFRPRQDQWEKLLLLLKGNPELTPSIMIRRGLDLAIAEEKALQRGRGVLQSTSVPQVHPEPETRTSPASGKSRKAAHRQEGHPLAQAKIDPSKLPDSAGEMVSHLIRAWMHRNHVKKITDAAEMLLADLDVRYPTFLNWFHDRSHPRGMTLRVLVSRLVE